MFTICTHFICTKIRKYDVLKYVNTMYQNTYIRYTLGTRSAPPRSCANSYRKNRATSYYKCVGIHTHTYTHTYTRTRTRTHAHAYAHAHAHACTHVDTHTHIGSQNFFNSLNSVSTRVCTDLVREF